MRVLSRLLIAVVVLVVGVPVVAIAGFAIWWHHATTGPDVRAVTGSDSFRRQRAAAVGVLDQTVAAFAGTAPHPTRLATAVRDRCTAEAAFFGQRPTMRCDRHVRVFLAFDGDRAAVQRTWNRSLAAAWEAQVDQPADIYQGFRYRYAEAPRVQLEWRTRPAAREPIGDFERGIPEKDYDGVTLEQQPVDVAQVYRDAYAHHRSVVELSTGAQYYPDAPTAPQSPSPSPSTSWNGCFGGHNCPGG